MISIRKISMLLMASCIWAACSTAPTAQVGSTEEEKTWTGEGIRFPASSSAVEQKFCSAISGFNMKLSKAHQHIGLAECQQMIVSNMSVCQKFQFCDLPGEARLQIGQNKTRANLLIASLNEKVAGPTRHFRQISNLKFRSSIRSVKEHIGFQDLEQIVANSHQEQSSR